MSTGGVSAPLRAALALSVAGAVAAIIACACAGEIRDLPKSTSNTTSNNVDKTTLPPEGADQHENWAVRGESWEAALRDASLTLGVLSIILSVLGAVTLTLMSLRRVSDLGRTRQAVKCWVVFEVLLLLAIAGALITDLVFVGEIEAFCVNEEDTCAACATNCADTSLNQTKVVYECIHVAGTESRDCYYYECDFKKLCEETPPLAVGVIAGLCLTFLFGVLHSCVVYCGIDIIAPDRNIDRSAFYGVAEVENEDYGSTDGLGRF